MATFARLLTTQIEPANRPETAHRSAPLLRICCHQVAFDTTQPAHQALRNIVAERTRPLLAWVGAGLSKPAGMPLWGEMRDSLVEALELKANSLDHTGAKRARALAANASREANLWQAFELLQQGLQPAAFHDQVRKALQTAVSVEIPTAYVLLWDLPLRGVLNLNLDGLATRALLQHGAGGAASVQHNGRDLARLRHVLTGQAPFIGNLHGWLDDTNSWVFTQTEIQRLLSDEVYTEFLRICLSMHTVLFLGITVDDFAVGGLLESLSRQGVQTPTHYWLTHRTDALTDYWAQRAGVDVIRYGVAGGDHSAVEEFLSDLARARPAAESPAPPVALGRPSNEHEVPSPDEMSTWAPDRIREALKTLTPRQSSARIRMRLTSHTRRSCRRTGSPSTKLGTSAESRAKIGSLDTR